jgi:transposase
VARQAFRRRAEWVERSFALILDRGGMRRAWLRGRANIHKRYLIHVAGYNLGLIMRLLTGAGTQRELHARGAAYLFCIILLDGALLAIIAFTDKHPLEAAFNAHMPAEFPGAWRVRCRRLSPIHF